MSSIAPSRSSARIEILYNNVGGSTVADGRSRQSRMKSLAQDDSRVFGDLARLAAT